MLDPSVLRATFPSLVDSDVLHFDAPAGTQMPASVIDAISVGLRDAASNVGGRFSASDRSGNVVVAARSAAADFLGGRPDEVAFGANMTSVTLSFSRALARTWSAGDRIVLSGLDHDANVTPWVLASADRGAQVVFANIDHADVSLDVDHLESLVDESTRLVAVTACSNAFGTLVDVKRVADAAHAVGAWCYVDAVHLAPHVRIDAESLGVDFLVSSAYKFYGPHVGILWGRREVLEQVHPYKVRPAPAAVPGRFETGTPSFGLLAGVTAAVEHIASLGGGGTRVEKLDHAYREVHAHESALGERFLTGLPQGVRVWGRQTMDGRVPTFAISVDGVAAPVLGQALADRNMAVWDGHHYAVEPMRRLGLLDGGGLVRIGFVATTTEDEVDRLLAALDDIAG